MMRDIINRLDLFLGIVWRVSPASNEDFTTRIGLRQAWAIAWAMYPKRGGRP